MTLTVCDLPLGVKYLSIQVIPEPLLHPSWTKKSSSILKFQALVTIFLRRHKILFSK